jgi:tRNA G10  N-methylase Trm11
MAKDLFGNEIIKKESLRDKWQEPPFTRLDAVSGSWQKRKQKWLRTGIKSELGRDDSLCGTIQGFNKYDHRDNYNGTSVFDPVLCELMYKWFCPENGEILDPFAGGSVRGIVANYLGFKYTGIELRQVQVDHNREQAIDLLDVTNQPNWYVGDSNEVLNGFNKEFDFVFSCPPYMDLEVYSDLENDLSTMTDDDFTKAYESIINKTCKLLKSGGYACFVVGDVRDKKTGYYKDFITITKLAFYKSGLKLYNEAILLENGLNTAAMRADKQFSAGKKLVKVHQNVLIFKKP